MDAGTQIIRWSEYSEHHVTAICLKRFAVRQGINPHPEYPYGALYWFWVQVIFPFFVIFIKALEPVRFPACPASGVSAPRQGRPCGPGFPCRALR